MRMSITAIREEHLGGDRELTTDGIAAGRPTRAIRSVGFWSAVVAAVSTIGYAIAQPLTSPLTEWRGMAAYASSFKPSSQLFFYFTIVLATAFVVLITAVHY